MDSSEKPIGIFDSGIGGLTVVKQVMQTLPKESIIYFGDTARVPYGGKSPETIIRYSKENMSFLLEHQVKVIVVACNTASAHAIQILREMVNIPVIEVIEPGVKKAVQVTRNQRIAVLGTKGTIDSGHYQTEIKKYLPNAIVFPIPCPLFVPLVEEHFVCHPASKMIVKEYLASIKGEDIDTLLLGCTHYPLLQQIIQEEVGKTVTVVDSATTCAEKVESLLKHHRLLSEKVTPTYRYFVSDDPEKFKLMGKEFLGQDLECSVTSCPFFGSKRKLEPLLNSNLQWE